MSILELFLLAVGLSMDAFAVSVCIGLTMAGTSIKKALTVGLYFGAFQAGMPIIGYFTAKLFADKIVAFDHWIAFGLLSFLGVRMIVGGLQKDGREENPGKESSVSPGKMLPLAVSTSIDAMAVGVSFAFLEVSIAPSVALIGITTLLLSMLGVKIGNVFGVKFKSGAEIAGGVILVLIGVKILAENLMSQHL